MKIKIRNELLPLGIIVIVLILVITFFPSNILRIILGLPFLLFFPGYTLMAALFPRRDAVSSIERLVLSFGLSIAMVPLVALILNFTPWGIRLEPILYSLTTLIFVLLIIAWIRRQRLPEEERLDTKFVLALADREAGIKTRILSIALVLTVLGVLAIVAYIITTPNLFQNYTEFYILGTEGQTADYPKELEVGEEGTITIGIINHEYETINYRVEIRIDGSRYSEIESIRLDNGETWEQEVGFIPLATTKEQEMEFLLYQGEEIEPYLGPLRLWINVTE